jgi:hypothetical protein
MNRVHNRVVGIVIGLLAIMAIAAAMSASTVQTHGSSAQTPTTTGGDPDCPGDPTGGS